MPIETLGDALTAGWRVHAKCVDGRMDQTHSTRKCNYTQELSLETLVWTRGRKMPLSDLSLPAASIPFAFSAQRSPGSSEFSLQVGNDCSPGSVCSEG
jgi:hypothetical protein